MTELFTQAGNILGITTIALAVVTLVAWLTKQKWRFRAFGTTAFMVVLTSGVWTLAILPAIIRPKVPGAEKFTVVFDRGGSNAVIVVAPTLTPTALQATLRKAAVDLGSSGRTTAPGTPFVIRARTVVHPEPGVSRLVTLGTLTRRSGGDPQIAIDEAALAEARTIATRTAKTVK